MPQLDFNVLLNNFLLIGSFFIFFYLFFSFFFLRRVFSVLVCRSGWRATTENEYRSIVGVGEALNLAETSAFTSIIKTITLLK